MSITTNTMNIDILSYDIDGDKHLLEVFPALNRVDKIRAYVEKKRGMPLIHAERDIMYIVLLYSNDSILNKVPVLPLEERKRKAAMMVGFPTNEEGEFTKRVNSTLFDMSEKIVEVVFDYMLSTMDGLWMEIVASEEMYAQCIRSILEKLDMKNDSKMLSSLKTKAALRDETKKIRLDLVGMYKEFFKDHMDVKKKIVYERRTIEDRAR